VLERSKVTLKEHQKIWIEATGRELPAGWIIHHINGDHNDNRLENLVALPKELHDSLHWFPRDVKYIQELARQLDRLLHDLKEEQGNRRVKTVSGKVRRRERRGEGGTTIRTVDGVSWLVEGMRKAWTVLRGMASEGRNKGLWDL